ncbi:hypothetical protein [Ferrimonas balearica]|uniref:hypothetical protein n=1 Tax=Ferrimonas balearica TaxID=44012 RepID=UPI001F2E0887|nr:hypothetical protein [Ferrimonas balearica]MBY6093819.1 hypothetical protein [Ferrimonas balearica]
MSTTCLYILADGPEEIAVIRRHYDGYPEIGGVALSRVLQRLGESHGGPDCLAASVVASFKDGPLCFGLLPSGTRDTGEEFRYLIDLGSKDLTVQTEKEFYDPDLGSTWGASSLAPASCPGRELAGEILKRSAHAREYWDHFDKEQELKEAAK